MICPSCTAGDHCGPPGQPNRHCPCQHLPPGTNQTVCQYACLHPVDLHLPGRGCTRTGCRCLWKAQDAVSAAPQTRPQAVPVSQDPPAPAHAVQRRTEDLDLPVPGLAPDGLRRTLAGVSTVELVADWMKAKRTGATAREALVGSILAERFGRRR